jgi:type IV pilus assembly protein PilC
LMTYLHLLMNKLDTNTLFGVRFGIRDQILLLRRLALYLRSGISLPVGLGFISEDTQNRSTQFVLKTIETTVATGAPLSKGFAKFPRQCSPFVIGFIQAGEIGGALPESLEHLANVLEKNSSLRKKIVSALIYPIVILISTISMAGFLTLFIFPKILPVLEGFHTRLPLATRLLMKIDTILTRNWILIGIICLTLGTAFCISLRYSVLRYMYEKAFGYLPLFGTLYRYYALSTLLHVLGLLLRSGIHIIPALVLVRTVVPGTQYASALYIIQEDVSKGRRFSTALKRHQKLFPSLVAQMIAAGEDTGTLRQNLESLARMYEEELDDLTRNLTILIEPILMVGMGCMVGFVALAIITPIYQVTQNITVQS